MVLYPNKLPESERVCFGICRQAKTAQYGISKNGIQILLSQIIPLNYSGKYTHSSKNAEKVDNDRNYGYCSKIFRRNQSCQYGGHD